MGREDEMIVERKKKIAELVKNKILPYSYRFERKDFCQNLQETYKDLAPEQTGKQAVVSGRLVSIRDLGKLIFAVLKDKTGTVQIVLQNDKTPSEQMDIFKKFIDAGDFIGVKGEVFRTKRGELSLAVQKVDLLTKSVRPIPEQFYGLQDKEERYRKRYLDLILDPKVAEIFKVRAKMLEAMRDFMKVKGFLEVETPLLQAIYGGAAAKPFVTHCDAFDSDVFLSIAPELYLKKAMVGGLGSVYEITKKFRNEGVDKSHNPEHMTIEWYQENADYEDGMIIFEEFLKYVALKVFGKMSFEYKGHTIDLSKWEKLTLEQAIKKYLNEDVSKVKTDSQAKEIAKKYGINPNEVTKVNLPDELMKIFREKLIQPTFLMDYPIGLAPLAKPKRGDPSKAEIFQPFIGGLEVGRAYSELSDPSVQESHFQEQENERKVGNQEAMPTDKDFIEALEYGLPPACGVGIGIERLVMLFTNTDSIRDVIMFPFMKSVQEESPKPKKEVKPAKDIKKSKK